MTSSKSTRGVVSAPQPLAVEAGADVLNRGGNAMDAAIAAAFVQGVVDPQMCGLGGGGAATVFDPVSGTTGVCDFYARTPLAASPDMFADRIVGNASWGGFILGDRANEIGYLSICTPAAVQGLAALHERFGSLPWGQLLEPAIALAEEGAPVYHHVHERWTRQVGGFVDCITRHQATPACAAQYMHGGAMLDVGQRMDTRAYGRTLRRLADAGPQDFVDGETARAISEDMARNGGLVTMEDLAAAVPGWRQPVSGSYRGYRIEGPPPPGGGIAVISILNILSGFDLRALGHNSAEHLHVLASAIRLGLEDWKTHTGDPAYIDSPTEWLISQERAGELRETIGQPWPVQPDDRVPDGRDTTQISVMTADGASVSMTHTLGLGSGVVTPGLGFMYNNAMMLFDPRPGGPNSVGPRRVRQHALASCILFDDESPLLAVGAPGGHGIISGVVQTISNIVDFGMTPGDAVSAPRIHCEGPVVQLEARLPRGVARALAEWGHEIQHSLYSYDFFSGRPHVVMRDPASGRLSGGADPRGGGMVLSG